MPVLIRPTDVLVVARVAQNNGQEQVYFRFVIDPGMCDILYTPVDVVGYLTVKIEQAVRDMRKRVSPLDLVPKEEWEVRCHEFIAPAHEHELPVKSHNAERRLIVELLKDA